ncbi:MAG: 4Fe-4S binding protein [Nitrospinae bacterium]|nr:4Fe-4S binding protein [Nitrospinota bacterium]
MIIKMRYDLLKIKILKSLIKIRPFQFTLQILPVFLFALVILSGLFGSQIPGRNLATVLTWTIWWAGIIFLILFSGASWCLVCPWMAVGNWIQRMSFWRKNDKPFGLGSRWKGSLELGALSFELKSRYPAVIFFFIVSALELGIFITYSPLYTAYLSFLILFLAVITALIWDKNIFCRYICFVGAIIGMYSNLSPIEVRSRNKDVCAGCKTKDCINGNSNGYGCPIFEYPGGMDKNTNCILCTECIKTCPHDNMTVNIRPFLSDLTTGSRVKGQGSRMDEAILSLTLLGLTIFHGVTMLPVWYNWAVKAMEKGYFYYIFSFLVIQSLFVFLPIMMHYMFSWISCLFSSMYRNFNNGIASLFGTNPPINHGGLIHGGHSMHTMAMMHQSGVSQLDIIIVTLGFLSGIYIAYKSSRAVEQQSSRAGGLSRSHALRGNAGLIPFIILIALYSAATLYLLNQPMVMRTN